MKENILIDILNNIKEGSTCYKYKVGALIVKDGRIISTGWNGTPPKTLECQEFQNVVDLVKIVKYSDPLNYRWFLSNVLDFLKNKTDVPFFLERDYHRKDEINKLLDNIYKIVKIKYHGNSDVHKKIVNTLKLSKNYDDYIPENDIHSKFEIHAEMNAISVAAKNGISLKGATLYCNYKPCIECAKIIVQSGIKEVKYIHDYVDKRFNCTSDELFEISNVKLIEI